MLKKIMYIHGSFLGPNFGDFLIFFLTYMLVKDAKEEETQIKVSFTNKKYADYVQCQKISLVDFSRIKYAICTGGGYFGEPYRSKRKWHFNYLRRHIFPLLLLKVFHIPYIIVGVDAGEISNTFLQKLTRYIFEAASIVAVRNEESKFFLKRIGVERNIIATTDWIMSNYFGTVFTSDSLNNGYMIIHLPVSPSFLNKIDLLIDDINDYVTKRKIKVIIITDNKISKHQVIVAEHIKSRIINGAEFHLYQDPFELLDIIRKADLIVTSKLHVGICGIRFGKKVISIANHPKIKRFYSQIGLPDNCVPLSEIKPGTLKCLLNDQAQYLSKQKLSEILDLGDRNCEIVRKFLREQEQKKKYNVFVHARDG